MDSAPPLRLVLVAPPGWQPAPWQSRLLGRLLRDRRFRLSARMTGVPVAAARKPSALAKALLALEARLLGPRQDRAIDDEAVKALQALPLETAPRCDAALTLCAWQAPEKDLARLGIGEVSVRFADQPCGLSAAEAALLTMPEDGLIPVDILIRSAAHPQARVLRRACYSPKPLARMTGDYLAEKALLLLETQLHSLARAHRLPAPTDQNLDGHGTDNKPSAARVKPALYAVQDLYFSPTQNGSAPALIDHRHSQLGAQPAQSGSAPLPRSALRYAAKALHTVASRGLGRIAARLGTAPSWELRLGMGGIDQFGPAKTLSLPRQHYTMADPFLFEHQKRLYLFYEATSAESDTGWIEVAELCGEQLRPLGAALKSATHLSYPFVFAHEGEVFMLPETQEAKRLEIWRAREFPLHWELYATAFEGKALADSSLFQHHGQWWLFTNLSDHSLYQDHSAELYLFAVDGPKLRRIEPHLLNPVVIGSDIARNAGSIIVENGRLFRASQMNAHGVYGFGLNLMQIDRLDRQSYDEHLYRRFTPADLPGAAALHHVSFGAGRHVIDLLPR